MVERMRKVGVGNDENEMVLWADCPAYRPVYCSTAVICRLRCPFAIYWYTTGKHKPVGQAVLKLDESNRLLLYIGCGLTLASLAIHQTGAYATQLGFPTTFVTYYDAGRRSK
jgi:hypothetical protein